jgi:hypothetical protein
MQPIVGAAARAGPNVLRREETIQRASGTLNVLNNASID